MSSNMEYLYKYTEEWNKHSSPKPQNDPEFIKAFIEFAKVSDKDQWDFTGENGYCGYTAILHEYPPNYSLRYGLDFEFAYDKDFVKVFTARHGGFWTPEYINLRNNEAKDILNIIEKNLIAWAGFSYKGLTNV